MRATRPEQGRPAQETTARRLKEAQRHSTRATPAPPAARARITTRCALPLHPGPTPARLHPTPSWPSPPRPGAGRWASCALPGATWAADPRRLRPRRCRRARPRTALCRRRRPGARPGPGHPLSGAALLHRRRRARTAGPWRPGAAAAAAGALPAGAARCAAGAAGENSPSAPSSTTSSTWPRPRPWPTSSTPAPKPPRARPARSLAGRFSRAVHELAERIVQLRTLVEATLDFPEEEIDFLEKADARGPARRHRPPRWTPRWRARARARCCARACRWCWPGSPTSARARC
jgi:hypothetical protein